MSTNTIICRHRLFPEAKVASILTLRYREAQNKQQPKKWNENNSWTEIAELFDQGWTWQTTTSDGRAVLVAPPNYRG